jgi:tetratricopeptide (TPR) repeat protein/O-antigen ligase
MSRLGEICERFIEAGWLVALAVVPLYVNIFTLRTYEPGKAYLLRVVVLLMAGAWVTRWWEGGMARGFRHAIAPLRNTPLAVPVLAYLLVLLITTATSVAPVLSLHGAFVRLQGAYTTLAYVGLFCLMVLTLRSREQFDRIVTVLLLASIPVAVYGVAQQWGLDPASYVGPKIELKWRVRSTIGQHIFLGAYLIMLMPWTLGRLIEAVGRWRQPDSAALRAMHNQGEQSSATPWLLGAGSIVVQNLALALFLVFSASNQQLGWLTLPVLTAYAFLVVWTSRLRLSVPPLLLVASYAGLLTLQSTVLALTQARGPWLAALAGVSVFGLLIAWRWRTPRLMAVVTGSAIMAGLFIALLSASQGPLQSLKQIALFERLGSISDFESRPIEMRFFVWKGVGRLLATRPAIGLSADRDRLAGIRPLIGYGPETLGLTIEKVLPVELGRQERWRTAFDRAHNDFLNHLAEGGLLGLGAFLLLLGVFYRMTLKALWHSEDRAHQLSLIALITAMTAHLVELQFGLAITPTRMLLWTFLAMGVVLSCPFTAEVPVAAQEARSPWRGWMVPNTLLTLLMVVALATTVKVQDVFTGILIGFVGMAFGMWLLALELGPLVAEQRLLQQNWWKHTITVGIVALLIFHGSFRPQVADAFYRLGQVAASSRQSLASILAYQRAIAADPTEDTYYAALGGALMRVGQALLTQKPDIKPPTGFEATAPLARTLDPRRIAQLGGDGALALGDASFQEARRLQPLEPRYVYDLARANHFWGLRGRQDRLDVALTHYRNVAEMSPNRMRVHVDWGMALLARNQPTEALDRIHVAQSLVQESWLIHHALALVHNQTGNKDLALKEAETAVRESPGGKGQRGLQELLEQLKRRAGPLPEVDEGS